MMPLTTPENASNLVMASGQSLLATLAASFVDSLCNADFVEAGSVLDEVFALRGPFPLYESLRHSLVRRAKVKSAGPFFLMGGEALSETLSRDLADAIEACETLLGVRRPVIVVEPSNELHGVHLTINCFPGLACIRLAKSSISYPDGLRHVAFHEMAHAFLSCGNRLLDEGWAHYFAHAYVQHAEGIGQEPCFFSLRALLSAAAGKTLLFEDAGANVSQVRAISELGARVVARIVERGGAQELLSVFRDVSRSTSDAETYVIVEKALGTPLDVFHRVLPSNAALTAMVEEARAVGFEAYETEQPGRYDAVISKLSEATSSEAPAVLDALLTSLIARAVLTLNVGGTVHQEEIAIIDMYFKDAGVLPEARLWTLRGHRAVLALKMDKGNFVKAATYNKKAIAAYEQALSINSADPDTIIGRALLFVNTPAQYGGSFAKGLDMIRSLTSEGSYAQHAQQILLRVGAAEASPQVPQVQQPQELQAHESAATKLAPNTTRRPVITAIGLRRIMSDSFSLDVPALRVLEGERVAIVGRNGCGKTTLLESIVGLRQVDDGQIHLLDTQIKSEHNRALNRQLGMSLQQVGLFSTMYVREIVRVHEVAYGVKSREVFEALGVNELMDLQYKALSRGQVQRVQLYLALAHEPKVVLLDEPSLGLDEWFANSLRALLRKSGATVVMISHAAADIAMADRVLIMERGQVIDDGRLSELKEKYCRQYKLKLFESLAPDLEHQLLQLTEARTVVGSAEGKWEALATEATADAFRQFVTENTVRSFSIELTTIDDFLAEITKQSQR